MATLQIVYKKSNGSKNQSDINQKVLLFRDSEFLIYFNNCGDYYK